MGAERTGPAPGDAAELKSFLAAIVESSSDAIFGKTLDGTITSWNAGAEKMYGYTPDEIIGHSVSKLVPADRARELVPILNRIRQGRPVDHFETKRVCKDGSVIDVSVSVSPIRNAAGTVIGAASLARDITERARADAERTASEARLHQMERMETLGQLAGGIAHDFNNLLAAIYGYTGLIAEATAGNPEVRADVEQIQAAAQRATALTRELLTFSRREAGKPEPLDLNAVVADLRDLVSVSIGEHIGVTLAPAAGLPAVNADRGRIEQVLLNLAVNARDAMPQGGTLSIATAITELGVGDSKLRPGVDPGSFAELTVSDTGTGMSPDVATRIFEPFFTTKPTGQGTGLGLSTVFGIVTGSGGCISVDSAPGAGTTFRIYLPAVTAAVRAAAGRDDRPAGGKGETVLVVDDEPAVLDVTARILRRGGYATLEANTWQEALSQANSHDFDLLLTDSVMPGMPGEILADRVRDLKPGCRVLHMSGWAGPSGPQMTARDAAIIQKPFTAEALLERVGAVLATG